MDPLLGNVSVRPGMEHGVIGAQRLKAGESLESKGKHGREVEYSTLSKV